MPGHDWAKRHLKREGYHFDETDSTKFLVRHSLGIAGPKERMAFRLLNDDVKLIESEEVDQ